MFLLTINLKKNNELNNSIISKSLEKNINKKYPLKCSISQNPIKKKFIGLNSAKSIFYLYFFLMI